MIVENLIPHSEGECINSLNSAGAQAAPNHSSQLIVDSIVDVSSKPSQLIVEHFTTSNYSIVGFQRVVKSILIPSYEGAQRAASKLIVICAFGLNELIELILASGHQPNSKISLIFREECRLFCEGVKATPNGLVSHSNLVDQINIVDLNGLVGQINLVGHTDLIGLINFVGRINGLSDINGFVSHNNIVDPIGLFGATLALIAASDTMALLTSSALTLLAS